MADVIKKAKNTFTKGLVMDFSPENTKNEVLTHALNATLVTFNGNELSLQNDMGNGRVETAFLPEGYIPVGTCEYGGIIYIVSYNPLEDKSQIGCFPSPERNISSQELGISNQTLSFNQFQETNPLAQTASSESLTGRIKNVSQCVILKNDKLNPGDKFIVCADDALYDEHLSDLLVQESGESTYKFKENPRIALNIVSIEESGKIVYLNSDLRQYENPGPIIGDNDLSKNNYKHHILGKMTDVDNQSIDIDQYRNVLSSGYNVFKSKTSGKLALLAELITIDSYAVTHSVLPRKRTGDSAQLSGEYKIVIHTEVGANIPNSQNIIYINNPFDLIPKLKYYYLQNSQGYIPVATPTHKELLNNQVIAKDNGTYLSPLFELDSLGEATANKNPYLMQHPLKDIYTPTIIEDVGGSDEANAVSSFVGSLNKTLAETSKFNFPAPYSYHGRMQSYEGTLDNIQEGKQLYTKFTEKKYHRVAKTQLAKFTEINGYTSITDRTTYNYFTQQLGARLYEYIEGGAYTTVTEGELIELETYYVAVPGFKYTDINHDTSYVGYTKLFKLKDPIPMGATKEQIYDTEIEKWVLKFQDKYTPLSTSEAKEYYDKFNYLYVQTTVDGSIIFEKTLTYNENATNGFYYAKEEVSYWSSLGFTVEDNEQYPTIYYFKEPAQYDPASPEEIDAYWNSVVDYSLFLREDNNNYYEATLEDRKKFESGEIELYVNSQYHEIENFRVSNDTVFVVFPSDAYVPFTTFTPNEDDNYIAGMSNKGNDPSGNPYEKDDPLHIYEVADYIPEIKNYTYEDYANLTYDDVQLATLKVPNTLTENNCDLLFKYDYTIVPCMDYGRLDYLAVSNTIDFSKLHNFDQSNFSTWKYRIDGNQLRLTFGADIYDMFIGNEEDSQVSKVDALVLEFYDLWGFAGSLEITGKKSYSGIFTKLLTLNTLGALSSKKIIGSVGSGGIITGGYTYDYCHNIGIVKPGVVEKDQNVKFLYNNQEVTHNKNTGWSYVNNTSEVIANDCGTLYSNIIYGVKTYIRQTRKDGQFIFTPKSDLFLFTLPIYNEYYYTKNNFNELQNPRFKFALTYKLTDSSELNVYNGNNITDGYSSTQQAQLQDYTKGSYIGSELNLVKYLTYTGKTDLNLEIGLQKEYLDFGISCASAINNLFSCDLQLASDDSDTSVLNVKGNTEQSDDILNYKSSNLQPTLNKLGFNSTHDSTIKIKEGDFTKYNFLYEDSLKNTLPIHYTFVVGYAIDITNIRDTQVPATTVCALCHATTNEEYNYEDFGIYLDNGSYYSKAMFYNEGTAQQEIFGICKQVSTSGDMQTQCVKIATEIQDAQKRTGSTSLNTGPALKNLLTEIGPLQFCQPHAHGFSSDSGVNIYGGDEYGTYAIGPEVDKKSDGSGGYIDYNSNNSNGNLPHDYLYKYPRYNLSLNTKMMIDHQGEFLSTIDYQTVKTKVPFAYGGDNLTEPVFIGDSVSFNARKYTGITGSAVTQFNKRLINTMKSVYAYNPDYDSIAVKLGDISIKDNNVQFSSNLTCKGYIPDTNLNDYICISDTKISTYLGLLQDHSSINVDVEQVKFKGNFTYCGTDNPLLISALTYNTPVPKNLHEDLSFSSNDQIVVQHANGARDFVKGSLNKKALYGFKEDVNSLIQLDVSNYTISSSTGDLSLKSTKSSVGTYNLANKDIWNSTDVGNFTVYTKVRQQQVDNSYNYCIKSGEKVITWWDPGEKVQSGKEYGYRPLFTFSVPNSEKFKFNVKIQADVVSKYYMRHHDSAPYLFNKQSFQDLYKIFTGSTGNVQLKNASGTYEYVDLDSMLVDQYYLVIDGQSEYWYHGDIKEINVEHDVSTYHTTSKTIDVNVDLSKIDASENYAVMLLIEVEEVTIQGATSIQYPKNTVIPVSQTQGYYKEQNGRYIIDDLYKSSKLVGTSLTLNDLVYDPKPTGHRLYVRSNCCKYNNAPRSRVFYRTTSYDMNRYGNFNSSWCYYDLGDHVGTQYLNNMYLLTGPCFT